jgi:F5/8 type C domain
LKSLKKYPFALIALLTVFASTWYAKTTWRSPAASTAADDRINVAAAANGGVALASSSKDDEDFPASSVIDGDRKGLGWGAGGGWADDTPGEFPDTMEVEFADVYTVDEIDVVTTQDTWWNPVEPTETLNFFNNGITAFDLEYFDGRHWLPISGGSVTGNTKVWRKFTFSPVVAEKIRIKINAGKSTYSMLIELEAYGVAAAAPSPSPTPTPSPLPTPSGDLNAALAERDIYLDINNNIGFGTPNPIFNDDGTTGAFVGKWLAIDGKLPGAAAYLGLGGNIPNVNERVGALNFYNLAMGGADNRTAAIFSFNGSKLGTGTLEFFTAPNFIGPVRRMQIAPTGEIGVNHTAVTGTMLQVMGKTADASTHALGVLNGSDRPLFTVRNDGQISVGQPGQGIVLKSPNGQVCRKLTIDDAGNLVVKVMASCP